jgi:hypothetical protein
MTSAADDDTTQKLGNGHVEKSSRSALICQAGDYRSLFVRMWAGKK